MKARPATAIRVAPRRSEAVAGVVAGCAIVAMSAHLSYVRCGWSASSGNDIDPPQVDTRTPVVNPARSRWPTPAKEARGFMSMFYGGWRTKRIRAGYVERTLALRTFRRGRGRPHGSRAARGCDEDVLAAAGRMQT